MFGAITPTYDLLNHLLSFNTDQRWRRRAVRLAAPSGPVLDVCTGTGDLAAAFDDAVNEPVVGVDFCAPMLRRGRKKKECAGVAFLQGDALSLPFETGHFDVVSVGFGLRNVADPAAGLAELARVTRPGGRIAILEFTYPKNACFRALYTAYFRGILPLIGNVVSKSRAYSYLNRSVTAWSSEEELAEMMKTAGCASVVIHPLTLGVAAVHLGVKA
jgi:demethylmenaquinone methyltransferase/2-methoxy-6-polyprenyl-1,4-benzoquinol methylase